MPGNRTTRRHLFILSAVSTSHRNSFFLFSIVLSILLIDSSWKCKIWQFPFPQMTLPLISYYWSSCSFCAHASLFPQSSCIHTRTYVSFFPYLSFLNILNFLPFSFPVLFASSHGPHISSVARKRRSESSVPLWRVPSSGIYCRIFRRKSTDVSNGVLLFACFLLGLLFHRSEGVTFLGNLCWLPTDYMAMYLRKLNAS
jgi:hypothetical protein